MGNWDANFECGMAKIVYIFTENSPPQLVTEIITRLIYYYVTANKG